MNRPEPWEPADFGEDQPAGWEPAGHLSEDGLQFARAALHPWGGAGALTQHSFVNAAAAQESLYARDLIERARQGERSTSFEFTMHTEPGSDLMRLFWGGETPAQHQLRHRLNIKWKYRLDPGVPKTAARMFPGRALEPELTPVVVKVHGRDVDALAEYRPGSVKLYPAHPKGQ